MWIKDPRVIDALVAPAGRAHEPAVDPGLLECENAVLIPHLGSATIETRSAMARLAARNSVNAVSYTHLTLPTSDLV